MAINEVRLNGETVLMTRGDTVSPETLAQGETATNRAGEKITGQMDGEVSDAYKITDPVGTISDEDYVPFNDVSDSTSPKKKTLFSAFIEKLKSSFLKSSGGKFKLDTNTDTVDYTSTDIDASRGDNNVSSIRYPSVSNILDRMKRIIMRTEAVVNPNGKIGWKSYVKNYDTDGNVVGQKGMQYHMDKSGNLEYQIDDFNAFRAAIQTVDQLGTTIPADSDLNDYMTAGTYRVPDDTTAASIENLPLPLCGKVVVLDNGNGGLEQVYFPNHEPRILVRSYWSSTWGDWKEIDIKTVGAVYALIDGSNISDPSTFRKNIKTIDQTGTEIPANADLNTYATYGTYQCVSDANARTMSNLPYTGDNRQAFKLIVMALRNSTNVMQIYIPYLNVNHSFALNIAYRTSDNNGTSWNNWTHFANADSVHYLSQPDLAHQITANQNLNDFTTEGTYQCNNSNIATTLSNCPVSCSFKLIVDKAYIWDASELTQRITCQNLAGSTDWYRTRQYNASTWGAWKHLASTDDISASSGTFYGTGIVSGSAITANISGYTLVTGRTVFLRLDNVMPANATLNVNSTGAKNVYYVNNVMNANTNGYSNSNRVWGFVYDGSAYRVFAYDAAPHVVAQNWVNDTSGSIVLQSFVESNAFAIKYDLANAKMKWNFYKGSAWRGDVVVADYDDIVHQTVGITIPENADLNDYKTNGIYNVPFNTRAATISNIPYPVAGKLIVQPIAGARYLTQIYTCFWTQDECRTFRRSIDIQATTPTWTRWEAYTQQYNGRIVLYGETTTAADLFVGIYARIKDTTTGKTYGRDVLRVYQDHNATESYGMNMVLDSGGNTIIASGESGTGIYPSIPKTNENLYLISDQVIYIESNGNTIANRVGFKLNNSAELIPVKAEVETDNFGSIGASGKKLANIWAYKINGKNIVTADDAIISNNNISTVVTSMDDIPINTAGSVTLDATISPTGGQLSFLYMCYGMANGFRSVELTRTNHSSKNTEERWYNANNGSGWTGWMPLSRQGTYVGTCATAANERAKVANVDADFSLKKGVRIAIKFSNTNTYSNTTANPITLNVNGTGAKNIWGWQTHSGAGNTGTNTTFYGVANRYTNYYYDGTYWVWDGQSGDADSDIRPSAYCETAAGTAAKTAVCTNYSLLSNSYLHVLIRYANTSAGALTLNVNGQGAKPIYINGAASSASNYTLPAGTYLAYYNGTNFYFRTDGNMQTNNNIISIFDNTSLLPINSYVSGTSGWYGLNIHPATDKNDMATLKVYAPYGRFTYNYKINGTWKGDGDIFCKWFPNVAYCTSSTEAATAAKVATTQGGGKIVSLYAGLIVCVVHSVNNTASNCTLNVDGTGAKQIWYNQAVFTGSTDWICGRQNMAIYYMYDGTYWRWMGMSRNDNSTNFVRNDASSTITTTIVSLIAKNTAIDAQSADNGVTSTQYPTTFSMNDKNNLIMTRMEAIIYANGNIAAFWYVRNYNGSTTQVAQKGIRMTMNKSGNLFYEFHDPSNANAALGTGYGTCATAAATVAKVATLANYVLSANGYVTIKFDNDVPANATLNINNAGAKNIYYRGVAITAGLIRGGDRATFIYNGSQYDLIGIDRDDVAGELTQTLAANATSVTFTGLPTSGNVIYDVYTSKAGLNYTDMDDSTSGQLKITFEAQSAAVTVYLRYHWIS